MRQIAFAALVAAVLAVPAKAGSYDELNAGIQLYNLGDCKVAIAEFDKALAAKDLIPDQVYIAHYDRGRAHLALSQFDQAIEDYSASLALRPGETQVLLDRSVAYLDAGKLDQAMSDLDRLVAAHPQLATPYRFRSFVHIKRGEIDKGRDDLKMVLKLLPDNVPRGYAVGLFNWEAGQIGDAEDNFSYEASHGAKNIYAWLWYALTEARLGKSVPRRALPDYNKKAWPGPIVGFFLGDTPQETVFAATQQGDDQLVRRQVCEANFYVGEWLLRNNNTAIAKPLLSTAAETCPSNSLEWMPAQMDRMGLQ